MTIYLIFHCNLVFEMDIFILPFLILYLSLLHLHPSSAIFLRESKLCVGACHCPSHLTNMSFHTFIFDWNSGCHGNDDDPEAF